MVQRFIESEFGRQSPIPGKFYPVPGYEELYEIAIEGAVRSIDRVANSPICGGSRRIPGKLLKTRVMNTGYPSFVVVKDGKKATILIHRCLAQLFIPNPDGLPEVNHIDGVKANFSLTNLEWCTHKQNMRHAFDMGLTPRPTSGPGELSPSAKLTEAKVREIKHLLATGISQARVANDYGVSQGTIGFIARGETWSHVQ